MSFTSSNSEDETYSCLICGESYQHRNTLKEHLTTHVAECSGSCDTLNENNFENRETEGYELDEAKSFHVSTTLYSKKRRTQKRSVGKFHKTHVCSTCGKEFQRKDHLTKHYLIHTGERPFTCVICSRTFARKDRLKEHCILHTGEDGFECDICGRIFAQKSTLRKHLLIHTGIKPYTCELCDRCFSRKSDRQRHYTIHSSEKPYACEVCGKRFSQDRLVRRHLLIHLKHNYH